MTTFFERISPWSIVRNHFATLRNDRLDKYDYIEAFLIIVLPMAVAESLFYFGIIITDGIATSLFNLFAIMGGFLINALILMATGKLDEIKSLRLLKNDEDDQLERQLITARIKLIEETSYNASFGILVCLFAVVCCVGLSIFGALEFRLYANNFISLKILFSFLINVSLTLFLIVILMVTKRVNHIICER